MHLSLPRPDSDFITMCHLSEKRTLNNDRKPVHLIDLTQALKLSMLEALQKRVFVYIDIRKKLEALLHRMVLYIQVNNLTLLWTDKIET